MKKFTKDCGKHIHVKTIICEGTDKIYRRCYTCKQYKPLDKDNFLISNKEVMGFIFQCKDCRNEYKRARAKIVKEQKNVEIEEKKEDKEVFVSTEKKQHSLFEENNVESKLNKILAYLGIK